MKICYVEKRFSESSLAIIEAANAIISEYLEQGYRLTLRQLYYQFVSRDWLANKQTEYKRLGSVISAARLAGLLDWDAIEDRGRNVNIPPVWESPADIIRQCAHQYQIDLWCDQEYRPEVWIEKEALLGVIEPICRKLRVPYFACKGYTSQSEMWDAGYNRIRRYEYRGQTPVIIHLGDHDPSGIDMTRDIQERLSMFAYGHVEVVRIALNMNQVEEYSPPPNPAKCTDSRFRGYVCQFGRECWELDALNPNVLTQLIADEVGAYRDDERYVQREREEASHIRKLTLIAKQQS